MNMPPKILVLQGMHVSCNFYLYTNNIISNKYLFIVSRNKHPKKEMNEWINEWILDEDANSSTATFVLLIPLPLRYLSVHRFLSDFDLGVGHNEEDVGWKWIDIHLPLSNLPVQRFLWDFEMLILGHDDEDCLLKYWHSSALIVTSLFEEFWRW